MFGVRVTWLLVSRRQHWMSRIAFSPCSCCLPGALSWLCCETRCWTRWTTHLWSNPAEGLFWQQSWIPVLQARSNAIHLLFVFVLRGCPAAQGKPYSLAPCLNPSSVTFAPLIHCMSTDWGWYYTKFIGGAHICRSKLSLSCIREKLLYRILSVSEYAQLTHLIDSEVVYRKLIFFR